MNFKGDPKQNLGKAQGSHVDEDQGLFSSTILA